MDGDLPSWSPTMVALMPELASCVVHFVVQLGFVKLIADKAAGSSCLILLVSMLKLYDAAAVGHVLKQQGAGLLCFLLKSYQLIELQS
ncbi:hypothetical protein Nepgr_007888 [Nepenthes gracilis]|uniref:Uncharacterized protein n=1 Tax=Nepenthes gracilis TaxID=150966 RepID=A0AAD3S7P2_NEPGR|nr:hypothetical protein Nepgr_007888 [Nepenthes gracilis]